MDSVVVGCPVANRAWVLPSWFAAVEDACGDAGVIPAYIFVVPESDEMTLTIIHQWLGDDVTLIKTAENPFDAKRDWFRMDRIHHMVDLRNQLLGAVQASDTPLFWSLDSDILPKLNALKAAINVLEDRKFDAVGMRTFMTPTGTDCTSRAQIVKGRLMNRADVKGTMVVDCIMAAKLMTPPAYYVPYEFDRNGEDIGWSLAARREGLTLGWTSVASCRHVMNEMMLYREDPRV